MLATLSVCSQVPSLLLSSCFWLLVASISSSLPPPSTPSLTSAPAHSQPPSSAHPPTEASENSMCITLSSLTNQIESLSRCASRWLQNRRFTILWSISRLLRPSSSHVISREIDASSMFEARVQPQKPHSHQWLFDKADPQRPTGAMVDGHPMRVEFPFQLKSTAR